MPMLDRRAFIGSTGAVALAAVLCRQAAASLSAESTFLAKLASTAMASGVYQVSVEGLPIWVRVYRRSGPNVIFTFNGSIDRTTTAVPVFGTDLSASIPDATIIGISDPALDLFPTITSGWYAGWDGVDLPAILGGFIDRMISALGATRVIFEGGSAGGFAALLYGHRVSGSIVVALNPQTNLDAYSSTGLYRDACWPNLTGPLASVIDCNLVTKYATKFPNCVVYVQNMTDVAHMKLQFGPFLSGLSTGSYWHLIPKTAYFGQFGHKSIPLATWLPAIQAALRAETASALDVLDALGAW